MWLNRGMEATTTTTTTTNDITRGELIALAVEHAAIAGDHTLTVDDLSAEADTFYRIPKCAFDSEWVVDRPIVEVEVGGDVLLAEGAPENGGPGRLMDDIAEAAGFEAWLSD